MKNQSFRRRAGFAIQGILCAWRAEASFRQQAVVALGVLLLLVWRRPAMVWWALLLMNCGLVMAAELFNTALEQALDHLHPQQHPAIEVAKDCAAAAVLVLSLKGVCVFITFLASTWSG
jgi:undecaprenol kinase